ncbi:hypothetical protein U1Q18_040893 [Sarracenia purpurea var. burkii]
MKSLLFSMSNLASVFGFFKFEVEGIFGVCALVSFRGYFQREQVGNAILWLFAGSGGPRWFRRDNYRQLALVGCVWIIGGPMNGSSCTVGRSLFGPLAGILATVGVFCRLKVVYPFGLHLIRVETQLDFVLGCGLSWDYLVFGGFG